MKLKLSLYLWLLVPCAAICQNADNGIYVGEPKVYDDRSLQILLNTARANLSKLQPLDITGIAKAIGAVQGADITQNQFALQAGGLPTAQNVLTTAGGTPSTALTTTGGQTGGTSNTVTGGTSATGSNTTTTNNTTTVNTTGTTTGNTLVTTTPSTTFQNVATQSSVSPTIPTLPGAATVAMPSTFGVSGLDTLSEQMQLTYEIANLQLLLEGSLSDRFIPGTDQLKKRVTIGFPMSITPPPDDDYNNTVAEVEVTAINYPLIKYPDVTPSVTAILPREKTYNVANIRESSFSLSAGAVVAGIFNLGGGFFHGHRTFYLIKEQDTVALQRPAAPFIEPVLGGLYTVLGTPGERTLWYWIVANLQNGASVPFGPIVVRNAPPVLSAGNSIRLDWASFEGAVSYDVLRSQSEYFPAPCMDCRVNADPVDPDLTPALDFVDDGSTAGDSQTHALPGTAFAWQFKPVLGQKTVVPGLRQTFVQLAVPISGDDCASVARLRIVTRWRHYDSKRGIVGETVSESKPSFYDMPSFDLTPKGIETWFEDLGNGSIVVNVKGNFMDGTHVRVGNLIFDNSTSSQALILTPQGIQFVAPAQLIASEGAFLVNRDGQEVPILHQPEEHRRVKSCSIKATPVTGPAGGVTFASGPEGARFVVNTVPPTLTRGCISACRLALDPGDYTADVTRAGFQPRQIDFHVPLPGNVVIANLVPLPPPPPQVQIGAVQITPFNDTTSAVEIRMDSVPDEVQDAPLGEGSHIVPPQTDPLVVLIGNKLFGLSDAPIEIKDVGDVIFLRFMAPTTLLSTYHALTVERLFWDSRRFRDTRDIKESLDASGINDSEFAIAKLNLLSTGTDVVFAVTGSHLDNVTVFIGDKPSTLATVSTGGVSPTVGILKISKADIQNLKQIALRKANGILVVLPLPDGAVPDASQTKPKPSLKDKSVTVTPGTQTIVVTGKALDQTKSIKCDGKKIDYVFQKDTGNLVVTITPITAAVGVRFLDFTFLDKSTARLQVEIANKTP